MEPFTRMTAVAAPIETANVNTDQIIPARFLRKPRDEAYHRYLFHDLRLGEDGTERDDFILNQPPYREARILVGARNFGCGSSREAAVFALTANDIRCVIAPSFGDIFFNNCFSNGVLAVRLDEETVRAFWAQLRQQPGATMTVDLAAQTIVAADGAAHRFEIEAFRKQCLLNGLDEIRLTLEREADIAAFEERYRQETSWLY